MGVRRTALEFEDHYTQIPNGWMRDQRLSRRARGVLAEIMTHRVGWHVSVTGLAKSGPEGRDAIRKSLDELKDAGYLAVSQPRGNRGRWNEVEYDLRDPFTADGFSVSGGFTGSGATVSGESDTKKNISIEDHQKELLSVETDDAMRLLDVLWMMWPSSRRSTRKVVEKSLRTAMKIADAPTLIEAVKAHTDVWSTWPDSDVQYVPLLSTWLNQERWTGALPQARSGVRLSPVDMGRAAAELLAAQSGPHLRALS